MTKSKRISISQKVENFLSAQTFTTAGVVKQYVTKNLDTARKHLNQLVNDGKATKEYSEGVGVWVYYIK